MYRLTKKKVKKIQQKGDRTRAKAMRQADDAFSKYVRTRDSQDYYGKAFKCISCGRVLPIEQADCGHYINRRHMATRFSEENCHAQCRACNRFDEDNIYNYRKALYEKLGENDLLVLEAAKHKTLKLSTFELEEIARTYKKLTSQFAYQIDRT